MCTVLKPDVVADTRPEARRTHRRSRAPRIRVTVMAMSHTTGDGDSDRHERESQHCPARGAGAPRHHPGVGRSHEQGRADDQGVLLRCPLVSVRRRASASAVAIAGATIAA